MYKLLNVGTLKQLTEKAVTNQKKRMHLNLHSSPSEPVQKIFNAISKDSYIRPHRHSSDLKEELLIVLIGEITLVIFDDTGEVIQARLLGGNESSYENFAVEIEPCTWHTVISNSHDTVILEIKAGPFDPNFSKDPAKWAPFEGSKEAREYFKQMRLKALQIRK